jgi:virginiamycin B lyase
MFARRGSISLRGRFAAATVFASLGCAIAAAQAHAYVYWANSQHNTIGRAYLNGTGINQSFITGAHEPLGVAADAQHIYWANAGNDTIGRANLDGTAVNESFITGANGVRSVAVTGQYIYWSNYGNDTIGRANLDGTGVKQNFLTPKWGPGGIATDANYLYWASGPQIGRSAFDGTHVSDPFISTPPNDSEWAAVNDQFIYWSDPEPSGLTNTTFAIGRASIDGATITPTLIALTDPPYAVAVDPQHLYWSHSTMVGRANLDGSGVTNSFIAGQGFVGGIALDSLPAGPTADITSPATNQTFTLDQLVRTQFSCTDSSAGPGVSSCNDSHGTDTTTGGSGYLDTSLPGSHTYTVTATSGDGATGTTSITYNVVPAPPKPPPPPPAQVRIVSASGVVLHGRTQIKLACQPQNAASACRGTLSLSITLTRRVRRHHHWVTIRRHVTIAHAPYALAPGLARVQTLRLSKQALRLLRNARHHRLRAQASATLGAQAGTKRMLTLRLARSRKR